MVCLRVRICGVPHAQVLPSETRKNVYSLLLRKRFSWSMAAALVKRSPTMNRSPREKPMGRVKAIDAFARFGSSESVRAAAVAAAA
eukprot:SAG11_NODE_1653_length_4508_cov_6.277387_3_plen_86_part_00